MSGKRAFIGGLATATPAFRIGQKGAEEFLKEHYSHALSEKSLSVMDKIFSHPSIERRSFSFESPSVLLKEDADARIERFTDSAIELSITAIKGALEKGGLDAKDISALVVNTCTGYLCPGLSTYLIEELPLRRDIRAFDLVGGGCGGAIPNLELAAGLVKEEGGAVLSVSVEICSATFQMEDDLSLIVSNALFGDGAAAAVVREERQVREKGQGRKEEEEGLEILYSASRYAPEYREAIRYVYKKGELHNRLSVALPRLIREEAGRLVQDILRKSSFKREDIKHCAIHPGGEKIIDAVKDELGLKEDDVSPARKVLKEYGNMSSPTVLFVLEEVLKKGMEKGDLCLMLSFGAGLSTHGMLMRRG